MGQFDKKIQALENFRDNQDSIVLDLIRENEHIVIDLNTDQLWAGFDSEGNEIYPEYSPMTLEIKGLKGQPTDRVTLKDTGDFWAAFFIVYGDNYFALGSDDPKTKKLEKKYGPQIFGLTKESIEEMNVDLRELLMDKFKQIL